MREYNTRKLYEIIAVHLCLACRAAGNLSVLLAEWTELYTVKLEQLVVVVVVVIVVVVVVVVVNISSITPIYSSLL